MQRLAPPAFPTEIGVQRGDSVGFTGGKSEAFASANAGTGSTLSVTAYTLSDGNGGKNYSILLINDTTGVINKAPLTITALTNTKYFDNATAATAIPTVSGLIGADTATGLAEAYVTVGAGLEYFTFG